MTSLEVSVCAMEGLSKTAKEPRGRIDQGVPSHVWTFGFQ
jgi:hypothetical protein